MTTFFKWVGILLLAIFSVVIGNYLYEIWSTSSVQKWMDNMSKQTEATDEDEEPTVKIIKDYGVLEVAGEVRRYFCAQTDGKLFFAYSEEGSEELKELVRVGNFKASNKKFEELQGGLQGSAVTA